MAHLISSPQPEGFHYIPHFLSPTEEHEVLQRIEGLEFEDRADAWYRGEAAGVTLAGCTGMSLGN